MNHGDTAGTAKDKSVNQGEFGGNAFAFSFASRRARRVAVVKGFLNVT
jgi:hypothetical protein